MRTRTVLLGSLSLLLAAGCDSGPAGLLEGCVLDEAEACEVGLVCALDAEGAPVCQIPAGGQCEVGSEPSGCVAGSFCYEVIETVDGEDVTLGRCLIELGEVCDPENNLCVTGLACEAVVDGTNRCELPLLFAGQVRDSTTGSPIEGAHVIALDDESVAVTDVAVSDAEGLYDLQVPATRELDGTPVARNFTLRGSADGYQQFPGGIRTALPINTSLAELTVAGYVIADAITDVVLIPLPDPSAPRVTIQGHVVAEGPVGGVLVVAEAGGVGYSAVSDATGAYTIFNVPPGEYEVRGYAADLQLTPVGASATTDLVDVDLVQSTTALTTLTGSINIVNAFGGAVTSVVLVVESTFSETFGRGEVPPGLRAPRTGPVSVSGSWMISGVPEGRYVVLAAFENDLLVRDPDQNIAGTGFVVVDIVGGSGTVDLADAFKVTEALAVVGPGADLPEAVSTAPTLEWADDSSEAYYTLVVYNAYGDLVWEDDNVPSVSGSDTVTVPYGGPLEVGMYYQFRATSWRAPGGGSPSPISTTEDLLGVFYVVP